MYVLIDRSRVNESIYMQSSNINGKYNPDFLSCAWVCCVYVSNCSFAHEQDWEKSQNFAHDTWALGLVKPILLPKFLVDYLSKNPILLSYMQNTTKKFAALIEWFARQGLVTNKRQMTEWILSTSSILIHCVSLRGPYGSA